MTPEQKYLRAFQTMHRVCKEMGWGDPFSYARSREIHMAIVLGHKISDTYSGADAIEPDGSMTEYKTTIQSKIEATYNGISLQPTWEEQVRYLKKEKIECYKNHYFARYSNGKIVELWRMSGKDILDILLPKIKKQYFSQLNRKDPRLGAKLTQKEIIEHSTCLYV